MKDISLRLLVIKTANVLPVVEFYASLGFNFAQEQHGNGPQHHAAPLGDGIFEVYPLAEGEVVDSTARLGFSVTDPDAIVKSVDTNGGRVIRAGRETSWGYIAIVADPDGRTVELYGS